jgi:hypothetical protein
MLQTLRAIQEGLAHLTGRIGALEEQRAPQVETFPRGPVPRDRQRIPVPPQAPADAPPRSKTAEDSRVPLIRNANTEEPHQGEINGFETLSILCVSGPKAQKPKRQVIFELGDFGTLSAYYHDVVEGKNCIVMIYDTRYTDKEQYLPPFMADKKLNVCVPHLRKRYELGSIGLNVTWGVFDIVTLVGQTETAEPWGEG